MAVLSTTYPTPAEAQSNIASEIQQFYKSKYPEVDRAQSQAIETAVSEVRPIYQSTRFPSMKTDWRSHPDNVGHLYSPGCFRCHDGQHRSAEGKVIPKDQHHLPHPTGAAGRGSDSSGSGAVTSFSHPVDIGDLTQVNCSDCRSGGLGP